MVTHNYSCVPPADSSPAPSARCTAQEELHYQRRAPQPREACELPRDRVLRASRVS